MARTILAMVALLLTGCGASAGEAGAERAERPEQRAAGIYAAALAEFLVNAPRAVGDPADMYVVETAYKEAGWDVKVRHPRGKPITDEVRKALGAALAGTAELTWVAEEDGVLRDGSSDGGIPCAYLRDGDLIVTLDILTNAGDSDEVSVAAVGHEFSHDDCAVYWLRTYVVDATENGWQVTGETVPQGVS